MKNLSLASFKNPTMENQLYFAISATLLLLVILMELWRISKSKNTTKNSPPGPLKLPIIGNLLQLAGSLPHQRLHELAKKYGPMMHLKLGQISTMVISSPDLAKEFMKTHDVIFASRPFSLAASVIAYNARDVAFSPYGEYWRQLKKICTLELLTAKRVKSFSSIRKEEVYQLVNSIALSAGKPVNLSKMIMDLSYSIISRTAFGRVQKQRDAFVPVLQKIGIALGGFSIADLFPSFKLLEVVTGMRAKLQKLHQEADAILEDIIREHRETKKSQNEELDDLVDVLLNLQDSGVRDFTLTRQDIKAVTLDISLAGVDTAATLIEWTMTEIIKQPRILEKAQSEVRRVFDGEETIDEMKLNDTPYLKLVLKEVLRLHPPGPLLVPRECAEEVEICNYNIPKKTQVIINLQALGRDPDYWTEPEKFYPERFLNSNVDYKGNNFEFIPFGAGRRMCPGMLFGMSVVELILASLLYHFDWTIPDGMENEVLDMSETFGVVVRRRHDLHLIPIFYNPMQGKK